MADRLKLLDGSEYCLGGKEEAIECFRCGICCMRYQPRLSIKEMKTIASKLGLSLKEFSAKYIQKTKVGYLIRHSEKGCLFLKWEGERASCAIYPFRPEACRNWQAGLFRPECREGLRKLHGEKRVLLPGELYPRQEKALEMLYSAIAEGR